LNSFKNRILNVFLFYFIHFFLILKLSFGEMALNANHTKVEHVVHGNDTDAFGLHIDVAGLEADFSYERFACLCAVGVFYWS
jgi:hypothetical protein